MIAIKEYPSQLHGYTIAAVCRRVQQRINGFNEDEAVIFGFNLTRRHGKFLTAYLSLKTEDGNPPTDWVLGHYYEDLNRAMADFLRRASLEPRLPAPEWNTPFDAWRSLGEGI